MMIVFKGEEHTIEGLLFDNQELTAEVARLRERVFALSTDATEYRELIANFRSALVAILAQ